MPLPERVINPVNISRGTLQCSSIPDELEGVTNGTLANIIRQLSSLSRHAEEMFGNLFEEAKSIANRSASLQERTDRLAIRVTQLDSTVEEVSLQDIQLRKAYRSSTTFDQQVVSRETMPKAMLEAYLACDKPPPLDNLNPYRLDGKDGLKFYTDPNYFFELWRQEMVKDTERMMNDRGKKNPSKVHINGGPLSSSGGPKGDKHKKRPRQPTSTMERQRLKALGQGEYIMPPNALNNHELMSYYHNNSQEDSIAATVDGGGSPSGSSYDRPRPNSIEIQRSYSSSSGSNIYYQHQQLPPQRGVGDVSASPSYADGTSKYAPKPEQEPKYAIHHDYKDPSAGLMVNQLQKQQQQQQYGHTTTDPIYGRMVEESPSKKRPSQPPPAPPPGPMESTPTRSAKEGASNNIINNNISSNLPLPPPPMQQLMQEVASAVKPLVKDTPDSTTDNLPPPPPAPTVQQQQQGTPSKSMPPPAGGHLPPSPPPPPPLPTASPKKEVGPSSSSVVPPPPPPPPPSNGILNGGDTRQSSAGKSSSPVKGGSSVLSPSGLKKPQPLNRPPQDDVRSDLLKAIRDGIALKKVEQREAAGETSSETVNGHIDVASILARRIAVEMSDSDEAQSDSECDSDDWGDESTA